MELRTSYDKVTTELLLPQYGHVPDERAAYIWCLLEKLATYLWEMPCDVAGAESPEVLKVRAADYTMAELAIAADGNTHSALYIEALCYDALAKEPEASGEQSELARKAARYCRHGCGMEDSKNNG